MKIIKKLSEMIDDEIDGALEYAENAVMYKDTHEDLGRMFAELAEEELGHVGKLHDAVTEIIKKVQESGKTVPTGMVEIFEYLHKKQIEKVNETKRYLEQFRA